MRIPLDSFVHHHGHATFTGNNNIDIHHLYNLNRKKFIDKWKVDLTYFFHSRPEIIELVPMDAKKILDIGCGAGAVGMELLNRQPCKLYGVELNSFIGSIASKHYERVDTIDIETLDLPWLDADDIFLKRDQMLLLKLKNILELDVDAVFMDYNLSFDEHDNVTSSLRRYRLVKREKGFKWIGAVHEYLEVYGKLYDSDIAVSHMPLSHDAERNLRIYESMAALGKSLFA